jgi:hypothetical protein
MAFPSSGKSATSGQMGRRLNHTTGFIDQERSGGQFMNALDTHASSGFAQNKTLLSHINDGEIGIHAFYHCAPGERVSACLKKLGSAPGCHVIGDYQYLPRAGHKIHRPANGRHRTLGTG